MKTVFFLVFFLLLLSERCFSGSSVIFRKPLTATVLVFLDTECPICQQYTRPLAQLYAQFAGRGVHFEAIFPSVSDNGPTVLAFKKTYSLKFAGRPDPNKIRVRQYRARVTPEVIVLDKQGRIVYQGAIDDWFVALGKYRREPTQHYLRDALNALVENRPIDIANVEPVGCRIQY